ncbi:unnamed protein product [Caenorhabditis angaria]|uniref:UBX domain-containing protein n=1 Tax=Caenorhabditis angaria TaxID=860376 RepID=A0A9P1J465_9PELO|nr:unnamed protein product [Caenorhabditis angaria]
MAEEEGDDALTQMMEITTCDADTAREYLERCNWNVETAVRHFFDGNDFVRDEVVGDDDYEDESDDDDANDMVGRINEERPREIPQPARPNNRAVVPAYHNVFQLFAQLFTLPVRIPIYILSFVYNWLFGRPVPQYKTMHEFIELKHPEFIAKKSCFYQRNLSQLRTDYQIHSWKYVVVYIHDENDDKSFFINCFESNISRTISENSGVLFGTIVGSDEANRLRPDNFGLRKSCVLIYTIQRNTLNRKLMITNLDDPEAVNRNIIMTLLDMISDEAEREARRNVQNENRRLMDMQNREYQESLQRDLERIEREKAAKAEAERLKLEEEENLRKQEARIKQIQDYKNEMASSSKPTEGTCDLMIRFTNDKKIIKFSPDEKLEKIFNEAMASDKCPLFIQMHLSFPKKPVSCLPKWYFDILEIEELEPKQECLDQGLTFEQAGITHGSLVYVDNL